MNRQNKSKQSRPGHSKRQVRNTKNQVARQQGAPIAVSQMQTFNVRQQTSRRIQNREMISSVIVNLSPYGFKCDSFPINPGISLTFPWLSKIAQEWQQYRFHSLQFRFITRTSTSTPGSIVLSPEYNPSTLPPTDVRTAMNTMDAVEDVPWKSLVCKLTPSAMHSLGPRKQVRFYPVVDKSTYDSGNLNLCSLGVVVGGGSAEVGFLWVDYDIELFVPQTDTTLPPVISSHASSIGIANTITISSPGSTYYDISLNWVNPLNTTSLDTNNLAFVVSSTSAFTLNPGYYMMFVTFGYQLFVDSTTGASIVFALQQDAVTIISWNDIVYPPVVGSSPPYQIEGIFHGAVAVSIPSPTSYLELFVSNPTGQVDGVGHSAFVDIGSSTILLLGL